MDWINEVLKFGATQIFQVEKVEQTEKSLRLSICGHCDQFDADKRKCRVCGCFMDVKAETKVHKNLAKLRFEVTHCPLGRWMDREVANQYRVIDGKELLN